MNAQQLSEQEFHRLVDVVLQATTADHALINANDSHDITLRFANNQVVQHVSVAEQNISIEVAFGQKVGQSATNRFDDASLKETVAKAESIAKLAPADPEYLPPLPAQPYLDIDTHRPATADSSSMDLAQRTKPVVAACREQGLFGAGITTASSSVEGVAASSGLFGFERATSASFSLTATDRADSGFSESDSSGWAYNAHRDIDRLGITERTRSAVQKAVASKNPREIEPGYHTVILEPAAVAGVMGPLFFSVSAKNYHKGNSPLSGKLGSLILDPQLTVTGDPRHPDLLGTRFNGDGLASAPITWAENGVLKNLSYDRFTAKEHNVSPTPPSGGTIMHFGGKQASSIEDLIATTQRGVLITNFWYIRYVNATDLTLTGMTRDGTFLIEDGKIVASLKNFRFHESPLRAFREVEAATAPMESITLERGKMMLPAMRLPRFHLSSVTKF